MKILDRYILTSYLKTFTSVFLILMMIFVLQAIWLYIKELAGKDLDLEIISKFLLYVTPTLIPLILPLTILLTSIMVFGSFAENYEFAAMKSTGISLQRSMKGLSVFIVFLGIVTFVFSNNVIPWANFNFYNLRTNIKKTKPAMAIAQGQFNQIDTYNIKVKEKSGDRGQYFKNVTIHEKAKNRRTNARIIKAKSGELISKEDSNVLKLILFDGNYYNDISPKTVRERRKKPFAKSTFDKYIISIDLSETDDVDFDDKTHTDRFNMLNINQLNKTLDSLTLKRYIEHEAFSKNLLQRSSINRLNSKKKLVKHTDTTYKGKILNLFETKNKLQIVNIALNTINSTNQITTSKLSAIKRDRKNFNKHIISFHEKLVLGFACIILFFVGAPLGALIRKGGIGLPMVIAILLFLSYHFIGLFAKNSAENGTLSPILGAWFSTLIMLPLGIFLTKRATQDKGLFEFGNMIEPLKKIFNIKEKNNVSYTFLKPYTNERLINVINNYDSLGHHENSRYEAIKLLNNRGISTADLRENGLAINSQYDASETISKHYKAQSIFAITTYSIGVVLLLLFFVFKNNKLPSPQLASIQLSLISLFLYTVYYLKSILSLLKFYKHINKKNKYPSIILLIIAFPLYTIAHFFFKLKIKEDLKQNCLDSLK